MTIKERINQMKRGGITVLAGFLLFGGIFTGGLVIVNANSQINAARGISTGTTAARMPWGEASLMANTTNTTGLRAAALITPGSDGRAGEVINK